MIKMIRPLFAAAVLAALVSGCASGVKYSEMASSIPTLNANQGRIYFLRSASMFGAAIQPEIRLNEKVVGKSQPGGFFYVDRPAGQYSAACSTETDKTLSFSLDAGETKYVRTTPSFGLAVGRINPTLETPELAAKELPDLSFTGATAATTAAK
jgi:outer membrane murein-binding lipoprotein Lpp